MKLHWQPGSERSLALRFGIVGVLTLLLLIPLAFVDGITAEREHYYHTALQDIAQAFGREQQVVGPLLVLPVIDEVTTAADGDKPLKRRLRSEHLVLPAHLDATVELEHQTRHRGLYEVPVYLAELSLKGQFPEIDREVIEAQHAEVLWDQAYLTLGIADPRAIKRSTPVTLGERALPLTAGSGLRWLTQGVRAALAGAPFSGQPFELSLTLAGTQRFGLAPLGDESTMTVTSSWPHPKFDGSYLPVDHQIDEDGFKAHWASSALARGVPSDFATRSENVEFLQQLAAVGLYEPVTQYTVVDRGLKYAVLFIGLTYLAVLCFEMMAGARLHLVQYGVVGLALALFYLVLLSLSEHLRFGVAYTLATAVIVALLGGYAWSITRIPQQAGGFALLQLGLYGTLFVLLKQEDFALLTGTAVLITGLATLMYVTRGLHHQLEAPAT